MVATYGANALVVVEPTYSINVANSTVQLDAMTGTSFSGDITTAGNLAFVNSAGNYDVKCTPSNGILSFTSNTSPLQIGINTMSPTETLTVIGNANISDSINAQTINATSLTVSNLVVLGQQDPNVGNITASLLTANIANIEVLFANTVQITNSAAFAASNGTAPFTVQSSTLVSNLNAALLSGQTAAYYANMTNANAGVLSITYGGTGSTTATGTGQVVLKTSPTITTPTITGPATFSGANGSQYIAAANVNSAGQWLMYNRSGAGMSWYINQKGTGTGGHVFGESTTANVLTEYMRLDGSGNLGLNTSSPAYRADINGDLNYSGNLRAQGNIVAVLQQNTAAPSANVPSFAVAGAVTSSNGYIFSNQGGFQTGTAFLYDYDNNSRNNFDALGGFSTSTGVYQGTATSTNGITGVWSQMYSPTPFSLRGYAMAFFDATNVPKEWYVFGSNDGTTFVQLDTRAMTWSAAAQTTAIFTLTSTSANYSYYRMVLSKSNNTFTISWSTLTWISAGVTGSVYVPSTLGTLGINISSPSSNYTLDCNGSVQAVSSTIASQSTAPDTGVGHGLTLRSTKTGLTQYSLALGVDYTTGYSYINSAGNAAVQPLLLQSRGGNVGINTATTVPAYPLDIAGDLNYSGNLRLQGNTVAVLKQNAGVSGSNVPNYAVSGAVTTANGYIFTNQGAFQTGTAQMYDYNNATFINFDALGGYNTSTGVYTGTASATNGVTGVWAQMYSPTPFSLGSYSMAFNDTVQVPKEWYVFGSSDGSTFTQVDFRSQTWTAAAQTTATFTLTTASAAFSYYRLVISKSANSFTISWATLTWISASTPSSVYIPSSYGNLCINGTSPSYTLDVNGVIRSQSTNIILTDATTVPANTAVTTRMISNQGFPAGGAGYFETQSNHPLIFRTNQTARMYLDTFGNVGINTSSPQYALDCPTGNVRLGAGAVLLNSGSHGIISTNAGYMNDTTGMFYNIATIIAGANNVGAFTVYGTLGCINGNDTENCSFEVTGYTRNATNSGMLSTVSFKGNKPTNWNLLAYLNADTSYTLWLKTYDWTSFSITCNSSSGALVPNANWFSTRTATTPTGTLSRDLFNTNLRIQTYTGNIGLNTGSPAYPCDIFGNVSLRVMPGTSGNAGSIFIGRQGDLNRYHEISATSSSNISNNALSFRLHNTTTTTSTTDVMTMLGSGFVGVNTTTPTSKIHILDTADSPFSVEEYNDTTGVNLRGRRARGTISAPTQVLAGDVLVSLRGIGYTSANVFSTASARIDFVATQPYTSTALGSNILMYTTASNTAASAERLRITDVGLVGINTSSPLFTCDVFGSFRATSTTTPGSGLYANCTFTNPSGGYGGLIIDHQTTYGTTPIQNASNDPLTVKGTAGSTWMVVQKATGNVGINTASPQYPLHISGTAANFCQMIETTSAGGACLLLKSSTSTSTIKCDTSNPIQLIPPNGVSLLHSGTFTAPSSDNTVSLGLAGNRWSVVYAGTGTINTSDIREKTDIKASTLGLAFVEALQPVSFKWIRGTDTTRPHYGFIAQQVKSTLTQLGIDDFGGWSRDENADTMQGLNYSEFIAPLTKAVQELAAENRALYERLAAIEARLF